MDTVSGAFVYLLFPAGITDIILAAANVRDNTLDMVMRLIPTVISLLVTLSSGLLLAAASFSHVWRRWHEKNGFLLAHIPDISVGLPREVLPSLLGPAFGFVAGLALYIICLFSSRGAVFARGGVSAGYSAIHVVAEMFRRLRRQTLSARDHVTGSSTSHISAHACRQQPALSMYETAVSTLERMVQRGELPAASLVAAEPETAES